MANRKRLIDANELTETLSSLIVFFYGLRFGKTALYKYAEDYQKEVLRLVDEAPTVDAVEVVRCKGCKCFLEYTKEHAQSVEGADGDCYIRVMNSDDKQFCACKYDDFCSYGERKDND